MSAPAAARLRRSARQGISKVSRSCATRSQHRSVKGKTPARGPELLQTGRGIGLGVPVRRLNWERSLERAQLLALPLKERLCAGTEPEGGKKCMRDRPLRARTISAVPLPAGSSQGPAEVPDAWWGKGFRRAPRRAHRQLQARAPDAGERSGPEAHSRGDGRDQGFASGGPRRPLVNAELGLAPTTASS